MDYQNSLRGLIKQSSEKSSPLSYSSPKICVGTNVLSGKKFFLPIEDGNRGLSSTHTYVLGSSGVGKSKFLEGIVRDIIKEGYGVMVLDGKGDLYDVLVDYCSYLDFNGLRLAAKTILIDPNDGSHSVGINYLEPLGEATPAALAGLVLEALKKFFGEDTEYKPWLEEWMPACLVPLIKGKFTLLELFHFLDLQEPDFRVAVLKQLDDGYFKRQWDKLKGFKPYEQAGMLNVVSTRAGTFWRDETLKAIFGQEKTTIDWLKVMNEGGVVLANLGRTPKLPETSASLIGAAILHQITTVAPLRSQEQRRPFFFVVDEFQKFVTSDFADALERMRGYGISLILSHQHRDQFEKEAPEVLKSIDANCRNKVVFAVARSDAEDMAVDIFTGLIHKGAGEIKDEIWQTKERRIKTYEDIWSYSGAESFSHTENTSEGESEGRTSGRGTGRSSGIARGVSTGRATGTSSSYHSPDYSGDIVVTDSESRNEGRNFSDSESESVTESESETTTHSRSRGKADTRGHTSGWSVTRAPWYDYEEYQELSSRTYYGLEEVKERFIAWVGNQDDRHAQWKFKSKRPIPIVTPWVETVRVTENVQRNFTESVYAQSARLTDEVIREIEERVAKFLNLELAKRTVVRKEAGDKKRGHEEVKEVDEGVGLDEEAESFLE